jgi:hypothetical protein
MGAFDFHLSFATTLKLVHGAQEIWGENVLQLDFITKFEKHQCFRKLKLEKIFKNSMFCNVR